MFNRKWREDGAQVSDHRMGAIPGKAFVQRGCTLQLLVPDLSRAAHVPELNMQRCGRLGIRPSADAHRPNHDIDFLLVENFFHDVFLRLRHW